MSDTVALMKLIMTEAMAEADKYLRLCQPLEDFATFVASKHDARLIPIGTDVSDILVKPLRQLFAEWTPPADVYSVDATKIAHDHYTAILQRAEALLTDPRSQLFLTAARGMVEYPESAAVQKTYELAKTFLLEARKSS